MPDLSQEEKDILEKVLKDSAKSYLKVTTQDKIQANFGDEKKYQINGIYPDLIVTFPSGEQVIEKIELPSTINQSQVEKWREFASLNLEFKLVVPLSKIEEAKNLASTISNVNVQAYEIVGDQINWFGQER